MAENRLGGIMTYRIAQTAYKNISRNKRRSILSGAAIGVAAMSIVILFAVIGGMSADMDNNRHEQQWRLKE